MKISDFLEEQRVEFDLIPHRDTYDAQRMAQTLHVPGREVAKTVLLRADQGFTYVVAVLPATKKRWCGSAATRPASSWVSGFPRSV